MSTISASIIELIFSFPQEFYLILALFILLLFNPLESVTRDLGFVLLVGIAGISVVINALYLYCGIGLFLYQGPLMVTNHFTCFAKLFVSFFVLMILVVDRVTFDSSKETLLLIGFSYLGMLGLISSNDWIFLFLSIELLSLSSYCLIAMPRNKRALEAVLKYFVASSLSTCLLLFGVFLLFVSCDTTSFTALPVEQATILYVVSFCLSALLLKLGVAPFHYWVPDTYENSPTVVTVFLALAVKQCFFFVLCRIICGPFLPAFSFISDFLSVCSGICIVVGCVGALFQKRVKRLLAYSSINNIGYILAGLSIGNISGVQASVTYMLFYMFGLLVFFCLLVEDNTQRPITYISDIKRLRKNPFLSFVMSFCLFSIAGIPPLSGFWAKFFILSELISAKMYPLAILGAFFSIISTFYYVNLVKILYFETGSFNQKSVVWNEANVTAISLSVSFIVYPLFPDYIFALTEVIAKSCFAPYL